MKYIKLFLNCISWNITNKNELKFKNYNNIIIIYHAVSSSSLRKKKKEKKKTKFTFLCTHVIFCTRTFQTIRTNVRYSRDGISSLNRCAVSRSATSL